MRQGLTPPRIATRRSKRFDTLGGVLDLVAEGMGAELLPWQRLVADVSLQYRCPANGRPRLVAGNVGVLVPRQCGKSFLAKVRAWMQCLLPSLELPFDVGPQYVGWLAQDRANALRSWNEAVDMLMASEFAGEVRRVRLQRGDESVLFRNGSLLRVITPNLKSPRGNSFDLVILDEAREHPYSLLGALRPTQAQRDQVTRSLGAQFVALSTEGDERGTLLATLSELGRRAVFERDLSRCWLEWSAEPSANPYDPATWRSAIPTLDRPNGVSSDFIRVEAESMDLDDFRREYLCLHTPAVATHVVDPAAWADCPRGTPGPDVTFAADATPDGRAAALVAAGMGAQGVAVEVVEHGPGLGWVAAATIERAKRWDAVVVVDGTGPLAFLVPQLEAEDVITHVLKAGDVKSAAARLSQLVDDRAVEHMGDRRLAEAVQLATRRRSGDRWALDRNVGDVCALVAAAFAVWAVDTNVGSAMAQVW